MKRYENASHRSGVVLSIVCAVRNGATSIQALFASYRRERNNATELVIRDGASIDATWDLILQERDIIDIAVSEPDEGIYDAWNKSLPLCRGRYVAFIGADDSMVPGSLSALVAACSSGGALPHIIAGFNILTRRGIPAALLGESFDPGRLHRRMMIAHVLSAHNLDWLRSIGAFEPSFRSSGDYELLLRERGRLNVVVIPYILAFMEDGGTSRRSLRPYTENFRARRMNGYSLSLCTVLFVRAMLGLIVKRILQR